MTDSQTPFRILIVDDDADAAEAFGRMLSGRDTMLTPFDGDNA